MNWSWELRSRDGGMNGLELARCTTAGGLWRVLVHAAPSQLSVTVRDGDDELVVRGDADREGEYSPITLLALSVDGVERTEIWPDDSHLQLPVLLPGGEVGVLTAWEHADDRSWWRWSIELSNHAGRPDDWRPEGQRVQRMPGQSPAS